MTRKHRGDSQLVVAAILLLVAAILAIAFKSTITTVINGIIDKVTTKVNELTT
jgi:hypothetical protein